MAGQSFEAASLPQFSLIRVLTDFGNGEPEWKMWVVLGHQDGRVVCIKATSQTDFYVNAPEMRAGCVLYEAGDASCFRKRTAIDPENQKAFPYRELPPQMEAEALPDGFAERLFHAIDRSPKLTRPNKKKMRDWIIGQRKAD